MRESHAIFPGCFDPWTYAHQSILERALRLFSKVTVAVLADSEQKKIAFSAQTRQEIIIASTHKLENVSVEIFSGLVTEFCNKKNHFNVIRGVRRTEDFQYEWEMYHHNQVLCEQIEWVLLPCHKEYVGVSSSLVKEIHHYGGDISHWVPEPVIAALTKEPETHGA